jgi:branched-subunit amino acid transport protein AzlD
MNHGIREEAGPIVRHAIVVLIIEGSLVLIGLGTKLLEYLFPEQKQYLQLIEILDVWLALALLSLFGIYTLLQVGMRLGRSLRSEWSRP